MTPLDITLIAAYFIISIGIALALRKRAGSSMEDFFLSGRKLPWWIAGTTMVATTFAADTPLAVTELVAQKGIAGNWLWWNMVAGSVLTVFFFAKLWRRSGVLTDVEFIELRYSGKPAAFLRGFRAVYLGLFMNVIIMGWVNVALAVILKKIFGISEGSVVLYIFAAMLLVGIYSAISGLWGIAFTDIFQFFIAMAGCIVLAVVVLRLPEVGGIAGLKRALPASVFNFLPTIELSGKSLATGVMTISFSAFMAHIGLQWWSSWYPGAEPGGGGYIAQRMMSAKDERHSMLATLWFTVAHYAIRPWPWIIVALAAMVLYPHLGMDDKKAGYILAMRDYLPPGLLGLLVAAFLAAYMSTISTHLNWGSSYLINDLYKRFIKKDATQRHYVLVSRILTLVLVLISSLLVLVIDSISGAWAFIIECGAGLGLVLILRWFWWRINAWSEIVAMTVPVLVYGLPRLILLIIHPNGEYRPYIEFPESLFAVVGITTILWIIATFITRPADEKKLQEFYKRVRPGGPGWKKVRSGIPECPPPSEELTGLFVNWIIGIILTYSALFSIGKLIFQEYMAGFSLLTLAAGLFIVLSFRLKRG